MTETTKTNSQTQVQDTEDLYANAEKSKSLFALFFEQFCQHKIAVASLIFLFCISMVAVFAPFVVSVLGVNPNEQNIMNRYADTGTEVFIPTSQQEFEITTWVDKNPELAGKLSEQVKATDWVTEDDLEEDIPYIVNEVRNSEPETYEEFMAESTPAKDSFQDVVAGFGRKNLLGTDELGRDILSRLIYGARISLMVAALVGVFSALLGLLFGATAGYFGGTLDNILMRVTDALLTIPTLPLYIIFAAADLSKIPGIGPILEGENQSVIKMVVVMSSLTWMPIARIVRGTVLSIKESEYILAAKTIGISNFGIIVGHVVPNVFGPLVVAVTLLMGDAMLIETGLSFLGLGIQPPMPSWGNMLQNALELVRTMPILAILPGLLIFVVIIAINFVGDGLRDALDPKAIRR